MKPLSPVSIRVLEYMAAHDGRLDDSAAISLGLHAGQLRLIKNGLYLRRLIDFESEEFPPPGHSDTLVINAAGRALIGDQP